MPINQKNKNTILGLPSEYYNNKTFWKKECDTVLSNNWLFVAFAHDLKNPGDAYPAVSYTHLTLPTNREV